MHARFVPLPNQRRSQEAYDTAQVLREWPGEWAHIETLAKLNRATNLGYRIRTGMHSAFRPAGAFDATARSVGLRSRESRSQSGSGGRWGVSTDQFHLLTAASLCPASAN
ncbi:hypothetical protein SSP24_33360 [Streptomyces spinoverrucosus]|uniref:Uncharacterized protein n=1 Tax=Streptomyces spinoverrucosus TaxID=284043 RepID=A0A4Y3VJ22_9ACTN|nr:hypothetical protein SSP24_33360 [Streptomyces spinoverrucosus]GHB78067.1 hypothetical protein GCM10010397_55870 [Streptomyces spinoverrucosus]